MENKGERKWETGFGAFHSILFREEIIQRNWKRRQLSVCVWLAAL